MKLVGMMAVRNEDWVLGLSARAALMWCDELVIGLHACTDESSNIAHQIAYEHPNRVLILMQTDPAWHEMQHRQAMLSAARGLNATHVAIIDADEIVTGNIVHELRGEIEKMYPGHIFQLPLYNLRHGIEKYHANGLWGNRIVSVAFVDDPLLHWGGDNFHHREPRGARLIPWWATYNQGVAGVMHLWGANERRLLAKHALYKVVERTRWPNKSVAEIDAMYSQCVKGAMYLTADKRWLHSDEKWTFAAVPPEWWQPAYNGYALDLQAEPWQEAEVRRIVAEHGAEMFKGLDLFGVV